MRTRFLLVALVALALAAAPGAAASSSMLSLMQDDDHLLYGSYQGMVKTVARMKNLGVDSVRATVQWKVVAPGRRLGRRASNPAAYRAVKWDAFDNLVRTAAAYGMRVDFVVTGPGPRWGHAKANVPGNQKSWKPSARDFGRFFTAVGRRYSGGYRDENQGRLPLPRVSQWEIWNEPNQAGWLTPQSQHKRGVGVVPTAPAIYRGLLVAGARALLRTGHRADVVMFGVTAPLGHPSGVVERKALPPALLVRELFCVNRHLRRYRGRSARARGCSSVRRLSILKSFPNLTYSHHPYTKKEPPTRRERHRDWITVANIARLPRLLDRIATRTQLIPRGVPIWSTEFGYETNPPDPLRGISLQRQAEWMNVGDYLLYRQPRVLANTQFLLYDARPRTRYPRGSIKRWWTYQSGLYTAKGVAKPGFRAYVLPFYPRPVGGGQWRFWGWLRFTPNGEPQTVTLQERPRGSTSWRDADIVPVTNASGFFDVTRPADSGSTWRVVWRGPAFSVASREVTLR